jgi:signal transduction histidine kinase
MTNTQPDCPTPPAEEPLTGGLLDRLGPMWATIFYLTIALGLYGTWESQPALLGGGQGVGLAILIFCFSLLFHRLYLRFLAGPIRTWPLPRRTALVYFTCQIGLLILLLRYNSSFLGLGFTLIGQICGGLRPRHWPIPLAVTLAVTLAPLGFYETLLDGDWQALITVTFTSGLWLFMAWLMYQLFAQRHRLLHLVAELRAARDALAASAAQQEELTILRERTRLAREMHDSLGHALVSIAVKLEAAQRLYARDHTRGDAELAATRELVRATMGELRRSLADLRSPLAAPRDLPADLARLAAELREHGISATSSVAPDLPALSPPAAEALWQVAREASANLMRHAGARHAELHLTQIADCRLEQRSDAARQLMLRICDDGVGISPSDMQRPGHFGIIGMRERVEALGGQLRVARAPAGGTEVEASLPL